MTSTETEGQNLPFEAEAEGQALPFEDFKAVFEVLLTHHGKRDHTGFFSQMYYDLVVSIKPTVAEVWKAIENHIDQQSGSSEFPKAKDLRMAVWAARVSMTKGEVVEVIPASNVETTDRRLARIAFLAGIYRHSGDGPLYRKMLGRRTLEVYEAEICLDLPPVTHDEVQAWIEANQKGGRRHA